MKKETLNANLIKKYHQDLVFNYSEYPTKDHWKFEFKDDETPTATTTASKGDLFTFRYNGSKWLEVGRNFNLTLS